MFAGPKEAKALLGGQELIRVATKYPNIAKDYFYNQRNQTVEIIKLNGLDRACTDRRAL